MADRIKGITIELAGDATPLEKALKEVDKASRNTSKELSQINRALKFDQENSALLKQKFDVLQDAIKNTETRLNALKQAQAEVDRQFQSGEIDAKTYRQFQREIEITEGKLKAFRQQAEDVKVKIEAQADTSALEKISQKLDEVAAKSKEVGDKMSSIGTEMSTKISAPLTAAGAGAGLAAAQFDNAAGKIQAALGLTADEAEKLEDKAKNVWKAGFGESLEEVTDALIRVKQNMHNLDDGEVEKVTQNALLLAKTFDSDVNEVTRAANNLMVGFGLSADEAFDLMTAGAQRGLNFSNELFDNLAEYVPLWSQMGFSAEEMFGVLERGVQSGVYNLDYLNDVMKEFQIRVKDGSKSTSDAFDELSSKTRKVWKDFLDGKATVADVAYAVVGELKSMDDQVAANQIGVALFGTKWEDLESKAMYAMLGSKEAMEGFEGATQKASQAVEQTFGQRWESFTRNAASSLEPLGIALLDIAEDWLPKVASVLENVANWFSNLSPFVQQVIVVFGGLAAAIGPVLIVIGQIVSAIGTLIPLFTSGGAAATAFGAVISALSGPVGIAVGAIAGFAGGVALLYNKWDEFKNSSPAFQTAVTMLVPGIVATTSAIKTIQDVMSPAIQVTHEWKDAVSEATAEAVGSFLELENQATTSLNQLAWSGQTVTQEMATNLISIYDQMGQQILTEMQSDHAQQLQFMTEHFAKSAALTEQEEQQILSTMQTKQAEKEKVIQDGQARIAEILNTAAKEKRAITEDEQQEINQIQQTMTENAVKYLTENEREQKVIFENLKNEASKITAEQAAEVVQNSKKQKDEVVKEAQEQYNKTVAEIIKQRDELGIISEEQARKLIEEAQKQRDETVKNAEEMHQKIVKEAQEQANEHVDKVNWETGEILSKWEIFKNNVAQKWTEIKNNASKKWEEIKSDTIAKWEEIKAWPGKKLEEMKTAIQTKMNEVKSNVQTKWNEAETFLKNINLLQIGKDIIQGLINGITAKFGDVKAKIESLASSIPQTVRKILAIKSPSRIMFELGEWTGLGLAEGIESTKKKNQKVMEELGKTIIKVEEEHQKEITKIAAEAEKERAKVREDYAYKRKDLKKKTSQALEKIAREEKEKLSKIEKKALEETQKMQEKVDSEKLKAIQDFVKKKKELEEISLMDEVRIWQESINYFKEGTEEKIQAQIAYKNALKTVQEEITSINNDFSSQIQKVYDDLAAQEEKLTQAYEDAVNKRTQSLVSFKGLFDEFKFEISATGEELITNLRSQVSAFQEWQRQIEMLAARAIDQGLLEELRQMGPNALPQLIELNKLTDQQLREYSKLYQEKTKLAREQAEKELIGMKNDTDKQIAELRKTANRQLNVLNREWQQQINSLTQTTSNELSSMREIGEQAVQGLLDGLSSQQTALQKTAQHIADSIKSTIQEAFEIHSPSRWMRDFIAGNMVEGFNIGIEEETPNALKSMQNLIGKLKEETGFINKLNGIKLPLDNLSVQGVGNVSTVTNTSTTYHETPVTVYLNYSGEANYEDVRRITDILENELGKRLSSKLRIQGVKR